MNVDNSYDIIKQTIMSDVINNMDNLLYNIELEKKNTSHEDLIVNNIIVNKNKDDKKILIYVPTEKWVKQLGHRRSSNY